MSEQVQARQGMPQVRRIGVGDILDALAAGLADVRAAPAYGLFFGGLYAGAGLAIVLLAYAYGMAYLAYPLGIGFALIGPFAATGLYEVSRRRAAGRALDWAGVLGVIWAQRNRQLGFMAFVTLFVLWIWMYQVRLWLAIFLGFRTPSTLAGFLEVVFTTPEGLAFLAVGHVVGALLALVLFSITVVSFPLLLERELDVVTAMITSVRSVVTSPGPMIGWAACVTALLILAMAPAFLGLVVVLPVLGHTTWHLYKKLVVPPEGVQERV